MTQITAKIWMQAKSGQPGRLTKFRKGAGMDKNTPSFNTEEQESDMVDLETTMNNKYGVRSGHYNL